MKNLLVCLFFCCFVCCISSCKSIQYVPIETVTHDTVTQNHFLYAADSIYIEKTVKEKGDTVYVTDIQYKYKYINNTDTITKTVVKETEVPYEVRVTDYKTPSWCWYMLGVVLLFLFFKIGKLFLKF